jgi:ABC-type spermidine/putrescine transport system permease subunit II
LLSVGILAGVYGSYMHIHGVGERVGGFEMRNFLVGPPLTLPAIISAVSLLGLIALYWEG